jgi:hypothetical protein
MKARHGHRMVREEMLDPLPQRKADAVTQFYAIEPEPKDLV